MRRQKKVDRLGLKVKRRFCRIGTDGRSRYVVCFNPLEAQRQHTHRERVLMELEEESSVINGDCYWMICDLEEDEESGECRLTLNGNAGGVMACAWSPDGRRLLSGSYDNTLRVWDARSGEDILTVVHGPDTEYAAIDLLNGKIAAASSDAWRFLGWRFFDERTGELRLLPAEHFGPLPVHTQTQSFYFIAPFKANCIRRESNSSSCSS